MRDRFIGKPITMMRTISPEIRFPSKLRQIFAYMWLQKGPTGKPASRFIIKGPRGGGKTLMMGAIGFARWLLKNKSIVAMGGSLTQAQNVYNYFAGHCFASDTVIDEIAGDPTMHKTISDKGNYFKAVAASQKQIRGPHPDDLFIDEACEAKDDIIMSALPMVSSSPDPLVVMTSTFHKIFGYFQETWDKADELGYTRLSWDIFDVVEAFEPSVWDNPDYNREIPDFHLLKQRAKGRLGDPEGWVKISNIIQAWREKSTLDWFDVEYMGNRPSASGLVNDPEDVDACVVDNLLKFKYMDGAVVVGGLDWGFSGMTAFVELMEYIDNIKVQINNKNWSQVALDTIIEDIVVFVKEHKIRYIYADSAGKFENIALQNRLTKEFKYTDFKCVVIEVVFSKHKFGTPGKDGVMSMFGNYRAYFQRRKLRLAKKHHESIWQHKRYRYQKNSDKPMKEDDHIPDATMLGLSHWPLGRVASTMAKDNTNDEKQKKRESAGQSTITGGLMDEVF